MLVFQACRMQVSWVMKSLIKISKGSLGGQAVCGRVRVPARNPCQDDDVSIRVREAPIEISGS
jgi:hypothetical protein